MVALEPSSYVKGVYAAFHKQTDEYEKLTGLLLSLEDNIAIAEKQLQVTRDYLRVVIEQTAGAAPPNWDETLKGVRFVGVRLVDACLQILREQNELTTAELIEGLNHGMYRWRSNSPAREMNAALLRQKSVTRQDDMWIYKDVEEESLEEDKV